MNKTPHLTTTKGRAIVAIAIVISVWLAVFKAIRSDWSETFHFVQYVPPAIIFAALLVSDRLTYSRAHLPVKCAFDITAIAIAASRMFITTTPFSGHMVLIVYGLITARSTWLRLMALALLVHTTVLKLLVWSDSSTWVYGLGIGAIIGIAYVAFSRKTTYDFDDR